MIKYLMVTSEPPVTSLSYPSDSCEKIGDLHPCPPGDSPQHNFKPFAVGIYSGEQPYLDSGRIILNIIKYRETHRRIDEVEKI
jgi:hypothetical protein